MEVGSLPLSRFSLTITSAWGCVSSTPPPTGPGWSTPRTTCWVKSGTERLPRFETVNALLGVHRVSGSDDGIPKLTTGTPASRWRDHGGVDEVR